MGLGDGYNKMGAKYGATKLGITQDLVENCDKDLEKLRRETVNIDMRKQVAIRGEAIYEPTEEELEFEKLYRLKNELETLGSNLIHASPKRI